MSVRKSFIKAGRKTLVRNITQIFIILLAFLAIRVYLTQGTIQSGPAPDFGGQLLDGSSFQLQDFRGKPALVHFWATWCKPCIDELPFFEELNDSLGGKELEVLLVSLDFRDKLESQLMPFVAERRLESEVLLLDDPHENEWIPRVDSSWSGAIPATLILQGPKREFFDKTWRMPDIEKVR